MISGAARDFSVPLPAWKRGIDLAWCLAALPFLALGALAMAVITRLLSPGPILFRQERVGRGGRRFMLYKFRTMHAGAATGSHQAYFRELMASGAPMQKLDARGDARIMPCGWLLRASGLDELPQVINVLRGDMSLVGPRPCLPNEYEGYTPEQRRRLDATPGLTGLWQVSGKNRTSFDEMVRFDVEYARTRSLWLDCKIMFLTVPALCLQIWDTRRARRAASSTRRPSAQKAEPQSRNLEKRPNAILS